MKPYQFIVAIFFIAFLSGCSNLSPNTGSFVETTEQIVAENIQESPTPFLPASKNTSVPELVKVFVPPDLENWTEWIDDYPMFHVVGREENPDCEISVKDPQILSGEIVMALVAPFPTIRDNYPSEDVLNLLNGSMNTGLDATKLVLPSEIFNILKLVFQLDQTSVEQNKNENLIDFLYANPNFVAIIPFDEVIPALKVMNIEGKSPFDQKFDSSKYLLTIPLGFNCTNEEVKEKIESFEIKKFSNRDSNKFTSVLLTGTTALVRATGSKMEINGMQYPGKLVKGWFDNADISHISNESSFWKDCPLADPAQKDTFFCSRPEYMDLMTYLGVDVVELTGNHLVDKGVEPLEETFQLLNDNHISYYAAGMNQSEAEAPAKFEHNGNKLAFIGCNEAGPTFVWVQDYRPGVLRCDFDHMAELVRQLVEDGFMPIVTYQYWESFQFDAMPYQKNHSYQMVDAGAVIVSGSQAHLPMSMDIYRNGFIHYGLGNLFFDQMDIPVIGTRREFLDRHIFYDGKYLGAQLFTALLEDYAQPRPMTDEEREKLLEDAFNFFQFIP
ncbi:MAG: CapA family protein [Anaerolineaceae bacterium]